MDSAKLKIILPQEGTRKGESLPEPSSGCPTSSGGGTILRDANKTTTQASCERTSNNSKTTTSASIRTNAVPIVRLERDPSLDRFSVKHWTDGTNRLGPAAAAVKRSHAVEIAGTEGIEATPSKVTTARRGKARDPGSTGLTRAAAVGEAGGSKDRPVVEPTCTEEVPLVADPGVLEGIELLDPASLRALAKEKTDEILEVAKKSGNLKGTFIKTLKEAAWTLQEVTATALTRTVASETLLLRRETRKLRQEVEDLKAELASLRSRGEGLPALPLPQELAICPSQGSDTLPQALVDALGVHMDRMERTLRVSLGEVVTARIEALDDRLLPAKVVRPPLAADRKSYSSAAANRPAGPKALARKPAVSKAAAPAPAPCAVGATMVNRPKVTMEMECDVLEADVPTPASAEANTDGWTTVSRRRRKKKKPSTVPRAPAAVAPAPVGRAPGRKRKAKLPSTPRSAAVLITLQPEALAGGLSYSAALQKARDHVALADLGIEDISTRPTATGSRIVEIRGSRGSEQADRMAEILQTVLADEATITRPVKKADVRVIGLDDSVTVEEVVAAAAAKAGCEQALIRAGAIRAYGRGTGAVHLSLPAAAARVLVGAGRLLVGWSAARVRLLEGGPLRCFKCMGVGHTRPLCPSIVDRGSLCFRCGQAGHKALECVAAKLHCALCAEAGRPAEHYMGGAACRPPTPHKTRVPPSAPGPGRGQAQTNR